MYKDFLDRPLHKDVSLGRIYSFCYSCINFFFLEPRLRFKFQAYNIVQAAVHEAGKPSLHSKKD